MDTEDLLILGGIGLAVYFLFLRGGAPSGAVQDPVAAGNGNGGIIPNDSYRRGLGQGVSGAWPTKDRYGNDLGTTGLSVGPSINSGNSRANDYSQYPQSGNQMNQPGPVGPPDPGGDPFQVNPLGANGHAAGSPTTDIIYASNLGSVRSVTKSGKEQRTYIVPPAEKGAGPRTVVVPPRATGTAGSNPGTITPSPRAVMTTTMPVRPPSKGFLKGAN